MNAMAEQINATGKAFVEFTAPMLIQSSVLILILLGLDLILRRRVRAVVRYWMWMLVLLKLVLPTTLSLPTGLGYWLSDTLPEIRVEKALAGQEPKPKVPAPIIDMTETVTLEGAAAAAPSKDAAPLPTPPVPAKSELASSTPIAVPAMTWQGFVFLIWLAVAAAMGLLLLQRAVFVRGLVAQSKDADAPTNDAFDLCRRQLNAGRKVTLKLSPNATSPAVCGLFRPVILVPHNLAARLSRRDLRAVFLHELAHIKRGDLWVNLVQTLLQIVYFYNPLLWLANAIIRRIREQAVDEMVLVAMGQNGRWYPETLVNVARLAFDRPALSLRLIGVAESKDALAARIKRILNRPMPKHARLGILGLLAIILAAAVLLPMAKAKRRIPIGINDTLNISDTSGLLKITSITMPAPVGKGILDQNVTQLSVGVVNDSEQDLYLGLEYYEDAGRVGLFSPGALGRAYIRKVPKNWSGQLDFQIDYIRFVGGGNLQLKLAKCPAPETSYPEGKLVFLPVNDTEILFEKKYILVPKNNDEKSVFQTAPDRKAFTSTLPNGVTVELVGLGTAPWEDEQQWWRPDGTNMGKPKFQGNEPPRKWPTGPDPLQFQCAAFFKSSSRTGNDVTWPECEFKGRLLMRGSLSLADDGSQVTYIVSPPNQMLPDSTDIKLAVGAGKFIQAERIGKYIPDQHQVYVLQDKSTVILHPLRTGQLGTPAVDITVSEEVNDIEFRVKARLKNGQNERWAGGSVGNTVRFFQSTPKRKNTQIENVEELILDYRPYKWVEFKNVSLKRGFETDVEVEAESDAGKAARGYKATLANGVTVELLGVCEHPSAGRQWWRPDGSLLKTRPYERFSSNNTAADKAYEFVYRIAANEGIVYEIAANNQTGAAGRGVLKEEKHLLPEFNNGEYYGGVSFIPQSFSETTVRIGVGLEKKFKTICTLDGDVSKGSVGRENVYLYPAIEANGTTYVHATYRFTGRRDIFRLVAVDENGRQHVMEQGRQTESEQVIHCRRSIDLPVNEIKAIHFQTVPLQCVTFKNVSLRPNFITDVQVEVQPGSGDEFESRSLNPAVDNKAMLSTGVGVELLGLTKIPVKDQPWWKPDGSPLEPFFDSVSTDPSRDPNRNQFDYYAVAIRLQGKPADEFGPTKWQFTGATYASSTSAYLGDKRLYYDNIHVASARFPKSVESSDLRLGLACGQWETIAAGTHMGFYRSDDDSIFIGQPQLGGGLMSVRPGEQGLHISVTYNITDRQFRVIAVDKEGTVHLSSGSGFGGTVNLHITTASFPDIARGQLEEYRFQVRPYEWAEFKDISLRPSAEALARAQSRAAPKRQAIEEWLGEGQTRRIREQILILRECHIFQEMETWASAVRELVNIGKPAVPDLVDELRQTDRRATRSVIAFTLRAIGDRRAAPALIEVLGRSQYKGTYGIDLMDKDLAVFMQKHQYRPRPTDGKTQSFTIGCPVVEITTALEAITGHNEGHGHWATKALEELGRDAPPDKIQQRIRESVGEAAQRWRQWWEAQEDYLP